MIASPVTDFGRKARMTCSASSDWVRFESDLSSREHSIDPDPARLLTWNASLPAGVKFVLSSLAQVGICDEYPRRDQPATGPGSNIGEHETSGMKQARRLWVRNRKSEETAPLPVAQVFSAPARATLESCEWEVSFRDDRAVVRLETFEDYHQATIQQVPSGEFFVFTELVSLESVEEPARRAIAAVLLRTGKGIRWIRPAVRRIEGLTTAVFEVLLAPTPDHCTDAFSSLSLACRMAANEATALRETGFATDYLGTVFPTLPSVRMAPKNQ